MNFKISTKNDSIVTAKLFINSLLDSTQQKIQQNKAFKKIPAHVTKTTNYSIYQAVFPMNQINQNKFAKKDKSMNSIQKKQIQKGFQKDENPDHIKKDNISSNTVKNETTEKKLTNIKLTKKNSSCYQKNSQKKMNICNLRATKLFQKSQSNFSTLKSIYNENKQKKIKQQLNKNGEIIPLKIPQIQQTAFQFKKRKQISENQQNKRIQNQIQKKKQIQFVINSGKIKKIIKVLQDQGKSLSYHYDGQILNIDELQKKLNTSQRDQLKRSNNNKKLQQKNDIKVIAKKVNYQIKDSQNVNSQLNSFESFDLSQFKFLQNQPKIFKKHSRITKTSRYESLQENQTLFYNNYKRQTSCIPYTEISQGVKIQEKTGEQNNALIEKIKIPTENREQFLSKTCQLSFRSYLPLNSKSNSIAQSKNQSQEHLFYQKFKSQTLSARPKTTQNKKNYQKININQYSKIKTDQKRAYTIQNNFNFQPKSVRLVSQCQNTKRKSLLWGKKEKIIAKQRGIIWKNEQLYKTLQF